MKRFRLLLLAGLLAVSVALYAAEDGYTVLNYLQIITGNLRVGDGTPTVTMTGEDFYCEGTSEFDGAARFDGALSMTSTLDVSGGDITLENDEYIDNSTDNTVKIVYGGATAALGTFDVNSASASPADNDIIQIQLSGKTDDDAGGAFLMANIQAKATDVTSNTADSLLGFAVHTNGTAGSAPTDELWLSGAMLYPNAAGGLNLGDATNTWGASFFSGDMLLDDGTGASPSFTMTDATNESAAFSKVDAGFLTITTVAGDGVQVTTGNLKVGNGSPGVTQDGEDAYVEGTLEVDGAVTLDGALTLNSTITRASQTYTFVDGKAGAGAGWVVRAGANLWSSTCPASQTSSTLVIPVVGLHVGDIITGGNLVGQVESAGGEVQINVELRKLTAAAADLTDATVSNTVRCTAIAADTILSVSNTSLGTLNETVGADETFYFLVTATTAGSTDIDLQGAQLIVTQK